MLPLYSWILLGAVMFCSLASARPPFTHPGCLSIRSDLDLMKEKVVSGEQFRKASWDKLLGITGDFVNDGSGVLSTIKNEFSVEFGVKGELNNLIP